MNKQQEALKLALEALEETLRTLDDENAKPGGAISDTIWYSEHETLFDYIAAQITAIREALAEQPAQQQEPVCDKDPQGCWSVRCQLGKVCKNTSQQPSKPWVGLTDEEMNAALDYWSEDERSAYGGAHAADGEYVSMIDTWRYIEAKLKEKNGF